jgi:hypothetical protein
LLAIFKVEVGNVDPSPLVILQVYEPFLSKNTVGAAERTLMLPDTSSFWDRLVVPIPTLPLTKNPSAEDAVAAKEADIAVLAVAGTFKAKLAVMAKDAVLGTREAVL